MDTRLTTEQVLKFLIGVKRYVQNKKGYDNWRMRKNYPELFRAIELCQKRLIQEQVQSQTYYLMNG